MTWAPGGYIYQVTIANGFESYDFRTMNLVVVDGLDVRFARLEVRFEMVVADFGSWSVFLGEQVQSAYQTWLANQVLME